MEFWPLNVFILSYLSARFVSNLAFCFIPLNLCNKTNALTSDFPFYDIAAITFASPLSFATEFSNFVHCFSLYLTKHFSTSCFLIELFYSYCWNFYCSYCNRKLSLNYGQCSSFLGKDIQRTGQCIIVKYHRGLASRLTSDSLATTALSHLCWHVTRHHYEVGAVLAISHAVEWPVTFTSRKFTAAERNIGEGGSDSCIWSKEIPQLSLCQIFQYRIRSPTTVRSPS